MVRVNAVLLGILTWALSGPSQVANRPKYIAPATGSMELLKRMDALRKELPPPQGIGELNGRTVKDVDGRDFTLSHLSGVARRLGVKTRAECLVVLTYLKDPDPKMRFIAARAIENIVQAYPGGMSLNDILEINSDGHRELIRRFVDKIHKLAGEKVAAPDRGGK